MAGNQHGLGCVTRRWAGAADRQVRNLACSSRRQAGAPGHALSVLLAAPSAIPALCLLLRLPVALRSWAGPGLTATLAALLPAPAAAHGSWPTRHKRRPERLVAANLLLGRLFGAAGSAGKSRCQGYRQECRAKGLEQHCACLPGEAPASPELQAEGEIGGHPVPLLPQIVPAAPMPLAPSLRLPGIQLECAARLGAPQQRPRGRTSRPQQRLATLCRTDSSPSSLVSLGCA